MDENKLQVIRRHKILNEFEEPYHIMWGPVIELGLIPREAVLACENIEEAGDNSKANGSFIHAAGLYHVTINLLLHFPVIPYERVMSIYFKLVSCFEEQGWVEEAILMCQCGSRCCWVWDPLGVDVDPWLTEFSDKMDSLVGLRPYKPTQKLYHGIQNLVSRISISGNPFDEMALQSPAPLPPTTHLGTVGRGTKRLATTD